MTQRPGISRFALLVIIAGALVVVLGTVLLIFALRKDTTATISLADVQPVTLTYWRVFDEKDDFDTFIESYQKTHPKVEIVYRKLRFEEYRDELLRAWSKGEGPNIFSLPNWWVGEFQPLIDPVPTTYKVPILETRKSLGIKNETVVTEPLQRSITEADLANDFVGVVRDDVVRTDPEDGTDKIYGIPLAMDNLALYYNRDMMNQAGISVPPSTWDDVVAAVPRIVQTNELGEISQGGIAMGTSENVERYFDILSILMMQSLNSGDRMSSTSRGAFLPRFNGDFGVRALTFYNDFANPIKTVYGWNETMPNSPDAFAEGKVAFFLGYSYHRDAINRAGKVNYGVAKLPQINPDNKVNYANYMVEAVFKNSENTAQAWDFIQFISNEKNAPIFLKSVDRPAARFTLFDQQRIDNPELEVFIDQALTADSWYRGAAPRDAETIFGDMITSVQQGETEPSAAVKNAVDQMTQAERAAL